MSLRCPACSSEIRPSAQDLMPQRGIVYRCPVCRLELVLDREAERMVIAPLARETAADRPSVKYRP